ncbi:hypothetical protein [Caballeronia catudaia]|uniref:hypothetical protein n=1 Tax=Caballeronia catudaia TaxID=1777136 RepID=UPI000AE438F9|nr:hypothetical protein [Caballeronia catudaia]
MNQLTLQLRQEWFEEARYCLDAYMRLYFLRRSRFDPETLSIFLQGLRDIPTRPDYLYEHRHRPQPTPLPYWIAAERRRMIRGDRELAREFVGKLLAGFNEPKFTRPIRVQRRERQ